MSSSRVWIVNGEEVPVRFEDTTPQYDSISVANLIRAPSRQSLRTKSSQSTSSCSEDIFKKPSNRLLGGDNSLVRLDVDDGFLAAYDLNPTAQAPSTLNPLFDAFVEGEEDQSPRETSGSFISPLSVVLLEIEQKRLLTAANTSTGKQFKKISIDSEGSKSSDASTRSLLGKKLGSLGNLFKRTSSMTTNSHV